MDTPIVVTVGMPVYNAAKFIRSAIDSVLDQTYSNFELIIADDASTDHSVEIIESYKDTRIKLIKNSVHYGIANCLNQIVKAGKGIYFARMDADDIMFPDRLKIQVDCIISKPNFDVIGSQAIIINDNNRIIGLRKIKKQFKYLDSFNNSVFIHPTVFGKLEWFKLNLYDITLSGAEDYELFLRTFNHSRFLSLQQPLLFYRDLNKFSYLKYAKRNLKVIESLKKNKNLFKVESYFTLLIFYKRLKLFIVKFSFSIKLQSLIFNISNSQLNSELLAEYQHLISKYCDNKNDIK